MAKALRYTFLFDSDKHSYKIECWQEGFTGTASTKRLGAAPIFVRDRAEAGIMGTSIELSIEAEANNELIEFYTVDSQKFLFKQYIDTVLTWQGYSLPEKYSESYIDAPYDVEVSASDGLGILKGLTFDYSGRYTILQILKYILDQTELILEFEVLCNIIVTGQSSGDSALNYVTVNSDMYAGKTCYEVITSIMNSFNAFITQKENRWLIARYSDILTESYIYNNSLTLTNRRYLPIVSMGSEQDAIPVGSLNLEIKPAKKSCLFTFPYYRKSSFLSNYNFASGLTGWTTNGVSLAEKVGRKWANISGSLASYYLRQSVTVEADNQNYELQFDYILNSLNAYDSDVTGKLLITVELTAAGGTVYKLTTGGWVQTSGSITTSKLNSITGQSVSSNNITINNKSIVFTGFPANGTLLISFIPDASLAGMQAFVSAVKINKVLGKGLQITATMAEKASESADDISIDFIDTPFTTNKSKILYNHFEPFPTSWVENSTGKVDSFVNTITRDYISHLAFPRKVLKGKIYSESLNELIFFDTHSEQYYILSEGTHDQLEEELDCELVEFLPYDDTLEIDDVTDWVEGEESGSSSGGSSGGSSSGGSSGVDVSSIGSLIAGADSKAAPANADTFGYSDSADSGKLKKISWSQLLTAISNAFVSVFAASNHSHGTTYAALNHTHDYAASNHTHSNATSSTAGFMSAEDKIKLDGATALNTAGKIVSRDANGKIAVTSIEINGWTMTID